MLEKDNFDDDEPLEGLSSTSIDVNPRLDIEEEDGGEINGCGSDLNDLDMEEND